MRDLPWARRRILRIFERHPSFGSRSFGEHVHELAGMLVDGHITVTAQPIPAPKGKPEPGELLGHRRESGQHRILKWLGREWMTSAGFRDVRHEVYVYGSRVDVFSDKAAWVIECGNTGIGGYLDIIRSEDPIRYTVIPFQAGARLLERLMEERSPRLKVKWPRLYGFDITCTDLGRKAVGDRRNAMMDSIAAKMQARAARVGA